MKLVVITPVGPGHEDVVCKAADSVCEAIDNGTGAFSNVRHHIIMDSQGKLGRSAARNKGIMENPDADWFFFLDADDRMRPYTLDHCVFNSAATFGAVYLRGSIIPENIYPCRWREIVDYGARGTLSMGFFCRADVARRTRFDETIDIAEDFDFYMRLPYFAKVSAPLVEIGYDIPSAVGPRGYKSIDWIGACNRVIEQAIAREPHKFGVPLMAVAS